MGFRVCLLIMCIGAAGCASPATQQKRTYQANYREHVKEHMKGAMSEFKGGSFPYYHWASPIVQEVVVPAHIANGMFVPEHKEMVIIKPGEWTKDPAYPLVAKEEEYEQHARMDISAADITHLPGSMGQSGVDQPAGKKEHPAAGVEQAE